MGLSSAEVVEEVKKNKKFLPPPCSAVQLSSGCFVLTDRPGMLHKYGLIKCVFVLCKEGNTPCQPAHCQKLELFVGRALLSSSLLMDDFFFFRGVGGVSGRALDENSEPELLCQEDTGCRSDGVREK